jgi:hypothetical protein
MLETMFCIGRKDFAVRAIACAARIHPVEGLAQAPRKRFIAPPRFGLISIL